MSVIYYTPGTRFFQRSVTEKRQFVPGEAALYFPVERRYDNGNSAPQKNFTFFIFNTSKSGSTIPR